MVRARLTPVLLLLLAACEGGSEGSNSAEGETGGQPTVQEAVPENLTDDPGNAVVPLDPPAAPRAKPSSAR